MRDKRTYELLADVLSYPNEGYYSMLKETEEHLKKYPLETQKFYKKLVDELSTKPLEELEEIYTSSFDIQALCYLDIGYVLFGEDYKRGAFLVEMNRLHRECDNSTGGELADHLPSVLRLLTKMSDQKERRSLIVEAVIPALDQMLGHYGSMPTPASTETEGKQERDDKEFISHLKPKRNPIYRELLEAVRSVLKADYLDELEEKGAYHA